MRIATNKGINWTTKKQTEPITHNQETVLRQQKILEVNNSLSLNRTISFYNCKTFGLRSGDEHRTLQVEHYQFRKDETGHNVQFLGRSSKNTTGGPSQKYGALKTLNSMI